MIASPGKKINQYYENLEKKREWDEASNRPLIEENDVVEFFKRLGAMGSRGPLQRFDS